MFLQSKFKEIYILTYNIMAHNIRSTIALELSDLLNLCQSCLTFHAETSHCLIISETTSEELSDQDDRDTCSPVPEKMRPTREKDHSIVNAGENSLHNQHTTIDKKQYQQDYYR